MKKFLSVQKNKMITNVGTLTIEKDGYLRIQRADGMNNLFCPYSSNQEKNCGDWCPHFGEPEYDEMPEGSDVFAIRGGSIEICNDTIFDGTYLIDNRESII